MLNTTRIYVQIRCVGLLAFPLPHDSDLGYDAIDVCKRLALKHPYLVLEYQFRGVDVKGNAAHLRRL